MSGSIVVVGSMNMDLVVRAPRHPAPGETILGSAFNTFPGGKGANQAIAAARAGGQVRMVGRVGDDAFGAALLAGQQADGVDTRWVLRTPGTASGVALITVNDAGQNNIVVVPGANGLLTPRDIRDADAAFEDAAVVLLQLEIPLETAAEAVSAAHRHGAKVILNPAPAQPLPQALLHQVDYLIPNEHELTMLTGLGPGHIVAAPESDAMKALGPARLIVTLGGEGVMVVENERMDHLPPHKVEVVDTTAAGDAFVGAFAVALTEGRSTLEAAAFGNAAGALAVTGAGAQPSLPARAAIDSFLR